MEDLNKSWNIFQVLKNSVRVNCLLFSDDMIIEYENEHFIHYFSA